MTVQPTPLMLRFIEHLEDGEWHDLDTVVYMATRVIPPGMAIREAERQRLAKVNAPGERKRGVDNTDRLIEHGRAACARRLLTNLRRRGIIETDPPGIGVRDGAGRRVRLLKIPVSVLDERQRRR